MGLAEWIIDGTHVCEVCFTAQLLFVAVPCIIDQVLRLHHLSGMDEKLVMMNAKIDAITGVYDDLHEKMHEIDKTRKNNLLFYGIKPDFLPEIPTQLEQKILEIIKIN